MMMMMIMMMMMTTTTITATIIEHTGVYMSVHIPLPCHTYTHTKETSKSALLKQIRRGFRSQV
jgi:hypothetical protein